MKKTKIVCTLGPASDTTEILTELINAGMNVARFNFSHGSHEEHLERFNKFNSQSSRLAKKSKYRYAFRG